MIYTGTFPDRPTPPDEFNVVDMGDTGKGHWARALVKGGKNAGRLRKPAQALTWLSQYWKTGMPAADKIWWKARATEDQFRTRLGIRKTVTGFSLFLMSNIAVLCLGGAPIRIPPAAGDFFLPRISYKALHAATNQLEVYNFFVEFEPDQWYCDYMVSCVAHNNATQDEPIRNTRLLGLIHPNETVPEWEQPTIPQYLSIPWAVNPGDKIQVHAQQSYGSQGAPTPWRGEMAGPVLFELTAT